MKFQVGDKVCNHGFTRPGVVREVRNWPDGCYLTIGWSDRIIEFNVNAEWVRLLLDPNEALKEIL